MGGIFDALARSFTVKEQMQKRNALARERERNRETEQALARWMMVVDQRVGVAINRELYVCA